MNGRSTTSSALFIDFFTSLAWYIISSRVTVSVVVLPCITLPSESPSGPPESVKVVDFVLCGQSFSAMSAGPLDPFNHAVSFVVNCDSQAELDRYWNALLEGGSAEECGWLKDRFGVSWQIVPTVMLKMMSDPDRVKAKRASDAMMKMVKLDIAKLTTAYEGKS